MGDRLKLFFKGLDFADFCTDKSKVILLCLTGSLGVLPIEGSLYIPGSGCGFAKTDSYFLSAQLGFGIATMAFGCLRIMLRGLSTGRPFMK